MLPLLDVRKLNIEFPIQQGNLAALRAAGQPLRLRSGQATAAVPTQALSAVRDLSFAVAAGEVLGLVGESGSGKSITSLAIMRLLPPQARVSGEILFTQNWNGPAESFRARRRCHARTAGLAHCHDLSGTDDRTQSGHARGRSDRGSGRRAQRHLETRARGSAPSTP